MPNRNSSVFDIPKHISGLFSSNPYFSEEIYLLNSSTFSNFLKTSFSLIFNLLSLSSLNSQKCAVIFRFNSVGKFLPISAICLIFLHCLKKYI